MHLTHLAHLHEVSSHGHFHKEQTKELRTLAQKSVCSSDKALSLQVTQTMEQIKLLDRQIKDIEFEIMLELDSVIRHWIHQWWDDPGRDWQYPSSPVSYLHLLDWTLRCISPAISMLTTQRCPSVVLGLSGMMQLTT